MKILHVVEATTAGVGRHVQDLAFHMQREGLQVAVACPPVRDGAVGDTVFVDRLRAGGVVPLLVPMRRNIRPLADLRALLELATIIRQHRYDLVHAHSSKAGLLARLASRVLPAACRPAVVYTPNAFAFLGPHSRLARGLYRMVERLLGQYATDALVCVSHSEMAVAQINGVAPADRLVLIENTIDATQFTPRIDLTEAKRKLGLPPDLLLVGTIGRLAPQKDPVTFIQAARIVLERELPVHFVLVGEGELASQLRDMLESWGLDDRVTFLGFRDDIPQVMAALDVFVLPSLYEGLPYILMEAMAAGRVVIASDVDGNRDLVEHLANGLLVPPRDPQHLADVIAGLLLDPKERVRLASGAQAAARARPTPTQMACQMVQLYERLLANR